jgi:hypothetical protein
VELICFFCRCPIKGGGRIGPYIEKPGAATSADLRNLSVHAVRCDEHDVLLLMSDGVADNLDPEVCCVVAAVMPQM